MSNLNATIPLARSFVRWLTGQLGWSKKSRGSMDETSIRQSNLTFGSNYQANIYFVLEIVDSSQSSPSTRVSLMKNSKSWFTPLLFLLDLASRKNNASVENPYKFINFKIVHYHHQVDLIKWLSNWTSAKEPPLDWKQVSSSKTSQLESSRSEASFQTINCKIN